MRVTKTWFVLSAALFLSINSVSAAGIADFHKQKGVQCEACHGADIKNPQMPTKETCWKCHPKAEVVAKTKNLKPNNPHNSPHYQENLDCDNCHHGHTASEDFCAQCHSFGFKVK